MTVVVMLDSILKTVVFSFVLLTPVSLYSQSDSYKVPKGKHVLVDGNCTDREWKDADAVEIGKGYIFKYKRTKDFAYVCVIPSEAKLFSAELFLANTATDTYTFHVSAKLGERKLTGEKWEDFTTDSNWWKTNGWTANALRPKSFENPSFLPSDAIEFQISRDFYKAIDGE